MRVLVAGIGTIGFLAAFVLPLRGANVRGFGRTDADSTRLLMLKHIGVTYVDERQVKPDALEKQFGQIDLIFEATSTARLEFDLILVLGVNGL